MTANIVYYVLRFLVWQNVCLDSLPEAVFSRSLALIMQLLLRLTVHEEVVQPIFTATASWGKSTYKSPRSLTH